MNTYRLIRVIGLSILLTTSILSGYAQLDQLKEGEVIASIKKANTYWQLNHPEPGTASWNNAAYHTGNLKAYKLTREKAYLHFSEVWAKKNSWKGATSEDTSEWKYDYGESPEYVLFGDWQTCFQVYCDLYKLDPDPHKIARARQVMEYQMGTPQNDYWWWVDGLYMVMPVMTRLYSITLDELYLEKLYEYFSYSRDLLYDPEAGLFYRDSKYVYPKHKTVKGLKDFWSRGNGWSFAAFARVLEDLPLDDPHREEYITIYKKMAASLSGLQQPEGFWTRSLMDPEQAPGPETSGTAFFTFGYLWGINNGILDAEKYRETISKSWRYLTETALQDDGRLGYVQPIGERAIPGQIIDINSTSDFGVGAFLLAASEMVEYIRKH
ncbi:MAG: glycoside hydrolase family 88 protein [Bacteroidales bacterium]|nr:glycoside hydrolase family 88 protein [Bacteroidales bacterium]